MKQSSRLKNELKRIDAKMQAERWKNREWYSLQSILGVNWAWFYCLLGGREAGKSYAITEYFVKKWKQKGIPFYWLRLNEASTKKLLANNAEKLVDPDLYRKYKLQLRVRGNSVYDGGKKMCTVLALSTFANDKGQGMFDKDFLKDLSMYYHICLDEFQLEKTQRSQGDIAYQFVMQMENLVRSTKERMRIFLVGNTLEECSDILTMFNFIPEQFGIYKLKKKRCVIHYMEPTDAYKKRRAGTVGDILAGNTSNYTNAIDFDKTLVTKKRLIQPQAIIAFNKHDKFTIWDGNVINQYNKENLKNVIAMRPYEGYLYNQELRDNIFNIYDTQGFYFHNLITQKQFEKQLRILKPRKQ